MAKAATKAKADITDVETDVEGEESAQTSKRVYRKEHTLDHDLYKLMPAIGKKNVGYDPADPIQERFEHSHVFHTIDSNGRKLTTCNAMGGHFHEIIEVAGKAGAPPTLKVGPPRRYVRQRVRGKKRPQLVAVPVEDGMGGFDDHKHVVQYLGSEKIQARQINQEAVKFQGAVAAPTLDGVSEL